MIIIADEATASNDDSVTAVSFLICRIRLWHAPSQDGGNLFICAEERGKGGQLASTIRQPSDKQYITAWDSQTNERGRRNVHSGWTEFCNHPATLITCIVLTYAFLIDARSEVWLHAYAAFPNIAFVVIRGQDYSKERLSCQTLSYRTMCINATSCMQLPVLHALLHKFEKGFYWFCHSRLISQIWRIFYQMCGWPHCFKDHKGFHQYDLCQKQHGREDLILSEETISKRAFFSPFARLYLTGCQV